MFLSISHFYDISNINIGSVFVSVTTTCLCVNSLIFHAIGESPAVIAIFCNAHRKIMFGRICLSVSPLSLWPRKGPRANEREIITQMGCLFSHLASHHCSPIYSIPSPTRKSKVISLSRKFRSILYAIL